MAAVIVVAYAALNIEYDPRERDPASCINSLDGTTWLIETQHSGTETAEYPTHQTRATLMAPANATETARYPTRATGAALIFIAATQTRIFFETATVISAETQDLTASPQP